MFKNYIVICLALCVCICAVGCSRTAQPGTQNSPSPSASASAASGIVERLGVKLDGNEPVLNVYVMENEAVSTMNIEEYLCGVLAGEMRNDWPMEALKAQAIIARTFVVKFLLEQGGSQYEGADISTDIKEAQAYDAAGINDRIRQAINETRGLIITCEGEPAYTWFHSHSGGQTALATEGLDYENGDPPYIQSVESTESDQAPEDTARWAQAFSTDEIIQAAFDIGYEIESVTDFSIVETGPSGRATVFLIGGQEIPAPAFRVAIGAERMRSTLIDDITINGNVVIIAGKGYGHGVGMSQWGAYQMAENGQTANAIIQHYYKSVSIDPAWN